MDSLCGLGIIVEAGALVPVAPTRLSTRLCTRLPRTVFPVCMYDYVLRGE